MSTTIELKDIAELPAMGWKYMNTGGGCMCWFMEDEKHDRSYYIGYDDQYGADVMTYGGDQLQSLWFDTFADMIAWAKSVTPRRGSES